MTDDDLKQIGQLMDDKLASTEQRLNDRLASTEGRIIYEIGKFLEDQLIPMIEEKTDKSDTNRLERKIDALPLMPLNLETVLQK